MEIVEGRSPGNLEEHMNDAFEEAARRLNIESLDIPRELCIVITKIDKDDKRRHWRYDRISGFEKGLPLIE